MKRNAFTMVELMVVIVVIAILAAVTTFGYNGWRTRIAQTQVKNDLTAASTALDNYKNFNNGYPTTLPGSYKPNDDVTITVKSASATTYCLVGKSNVVSTVIFYSSNKSKAPSTTAC